MLLMNPPGSTTGPPLYLPLIVQSEESGNTELKHVVASNTDYSKFEMSGTFRIYS